MRPGALTLLALISSVLTFAQTAQNRTFRHYWIKVKPTERAMFPYINRDTSYYFTCYDESDDKEIIGFLEIDHHWFGGSHGMMTPDFEKDPDGSKGIMKDTFNYYFENGSIHYLWEYTPDSIVSTGGWYSQGKNGKWFTGFLLRSKVQRKSYFIKTRKQVYKEDQLDSASVINLNSISWPTIKGEWALNLEYSNDSILVYHRYGTVPNIEGMRFINEDKYEFIFRNRATMKVTQNWWTIGDRLFLRLFNMTDEYKIISFTPSELILQHVRSFFFSQEFL